MNAESPATDQAALTAAEPPRPSANGERRFWIGLGVAALVHALIIFGTLAHKGRRMGEPDASPDGISVVILDAADLESRSSVPAQPPPAPPQAEAREQPPPPQQPQDAPPQPQEPAPQQQQAQEQQPEPLSVTAQEAPAPDAKPLPRPDAPGDPKPPPPRKPRKTEDHAAARPANPSPPRAPPRVSYDAAPTFMSRGGSFAPTRPPGITRSGENDEFGRGVIRALIATIPQLVNTTGRVTVRILLNTKGNLQSVEVVRPSGNPTIDQSVAFAVKQSNFPIPPDNSTTLDRTFFVTYIFTLR